MLVFLKKDQMSRKVFKSILAIFGHLGHENAFFTIPRKLLLSVSIGIIRTIVKYCDGGEMGQNWVSWDFHPGVKKE